MLPATLNLAGVRAIPKGADYSYPITRKRSTGEAYDYTGWTGRMQIRQSVGSTVLITLTTENGGLVNGGSNGTWTIALTDAQTALLSWIGQAIYDLKLTDLSGLEYIFCRGAVELYEVVTADA